MKYLFLVLLMCSCNPFNLWNDSPLEEKLEDIVLKETGVRLDLSGSSPDPS